VSKVILLRSSIHRNIRRSVAANIQMTEKWTYLQDKVARVRRCLYSQGPALR